MRLRWTEEALKDLGRLRFFLRKRNPDAAARAGAKIRAAVRALMRTPELGRVGEDDDLRRLVVPFGSSGYVILYRLSEEEVVIARLWHGREERE